MVRPVWALLLCLALAGCGVSTGGSDGDCTSHYESVATAATWPQLRYSVRHSDRYDHVRRVRVVERGDLAGRGDHHDIERVATLDVWRDGHGDWRAADWRQCTD